MKSVRIDFAGSAENHRRLLKTLYSISSIIFHVSLFPLAQNVVLVSLVHTHTRPSIVPAGWRDRYSVVHETQVYSVKFVQPVNNGYNVFLSFFVVYRRDRFPYSRRARPTGIVRPAEGFLSVPIPSISVEFGASSASFTRTQTSLRVYATFLHSASFSRRRCVIPTRHGQTPFGKRSRAQRYAGVFVSSVLA